MSTRCRRHRVTGAASSSPSAPSVFRSASLAVRSTDRLGFPGSGLRGRAVARAGCAGPPPNARESAPLVEAAVVHEADLLDDSPRGPVVGADPDVDVAEARNRRGVADHAPQGRGVETATTEARMRVEAVQDGRAGRELPRQGDLFHERAILPLDTPAAVP